MLMKICLRLCFCYGKLPAKLYVCEGQSVMVDLKVGRLMEYQGQSEGQSDTQHDTEKGLGQRKREIKILSLRIFKTTPH